VEKRIILELSRLSGRYRLLRCQQDGDKHFYSVERRYMSEWRKIPVSLRLERWPLMTAMIDALCHNLSTDLEDRVACVCAARMRTTNNTVEDAMADCPMHQNADPGLRRVRIAILEAEVKRLKNSQD